MAADTVAQRYATLGKTEITVAAATQAGIVSEKTAPAIIKTIVTLTGRITIDQNAMAEVRAPFPGIVRSVNAGLFETVKKGQVLAVVQSNTSLKDYPVEAPLDGTILARNTNLGDVTNTASLFTIADLSTVTARFNMFPNDATKIAIHQRVRVQSLDNSIAQNTMISRRLPIVDALSQTRVAFALLDNTTGLWAPGMIVKGDISVSQKQVPVAVRVSALQTIGDHTIIFIIKNGTTYEMRPVKTGVSDGVYIEILSGLTANTPYVSEGSFTVKSDILKATSHTEIIAKIEETDNANRDY
jgi:cobalt-zinc-cadmium efflux system membrane fusion protein